MANYQQIQRGSVDELPAVDTKPPGPGRCASCSLLAVLVVASLGSIVFLVVWMMMIPPLGGPQPVPCHDPCIVIVAESMPWNLTFPAGSPHYQSTFAVWKELISSAEESIDIASYYWSLRGSDVYNDSSAELGEEIFRDLKAAGTSGKIAIRIAQSKPGKYLPDKDTQELVSSGAAKVRSLDFEQLMDGGILHTKFWVVDRKHLYLGSANMDYRALTQVKEVGVGVFNCSCLAKDLYKLFEVYWDLGNKTQVPPKWPEEYETAYNMASPMQMTLNSTNATVFIGSSPPAFCPTGRTSDIDGLLHVIDSAEHFVYVAVMDYIPEKEFASPQTYWDVIDSKLRAVAFDHKVNVRVLGSIWNHTDADMLLFLKSLADLGTTQKLNIQVKLFRVPAYTPVEHKIPYSRVSHNKYMVTDNAAYIGTSNWSGTYFTNTGGASLVFNQTQAQAETEATTVQVQLRDLFLRDWNSEYAEPILNNSLSSLIGI